MQRPWGDAPPCWPGAAEPNSSVSPAAPLSAAERVCQEGLRGAGRSNCVDCAAAFFAAAAAAAAAAERCPLCPNCLLLQVR